MEIYEKYERLSLQQTLDSMLDIGYCPRPACGTAVLFDPDSAMATCSACQFVFCKQCNMTYHGIQPCNIRKCKSTQLESLGGHRSSSPSLS